MTSILEDLYPCAKQRTCPFPFLPNSNTPSRRTIHEYTLKAHSHHLHPLRLLPRFSSGTGGTGRLASASVSALSSSLPEQELPALG